MKIRKIIFTTIILIVLSTNIVLATPNVDVTVDPSEPVAGESIKVTANVTNIDDISDVRIIIEECQGVNLCFEKTNVSMDSIANGQYFYDFNLEHNDATLLKYQVEVYNQSGIYKTEQYQVDLKEQTNNDGQTNSDDNGSPGFEILISIIAFSIILFLYRKRSI